VPRTLAPDRTAPRSAETQRGTLPETAGENNPGPKPVSRQRQEVLGPEIEVVRRRGRNVDEKRGARRRRRQIGHGLDDDPTEDAESPQDHHRQHQRPGDWLRRGLDRPKEDPSPEAPDVRDGQRRPNGRQPGEDRSTLKGRMEEEFVLEEPDGERQRPQARRRRRATNRKQRQIPPQSPQV